MGHGGDSKRSIGDSSFDIVRVRYLCSLQSCFLYYILIFIPHLFCNAQIIGIHMQWGIVAGIFINIGKQSIAYLVSKEALFGIGLTRLRICLLQIHNYTILSKFEIFISHINAIDLDFQ